MLFLICLEVLRTILTMEGMFIQTQSPAKNENARKAVPSHTHTHTHTHTGVHTRTAGRVHLSIYLSSSPLSRPTNRLLRTCLASWTRVARVAQASQCLSRSDSQRQEGVRSPTQQRHALCRPVACSLRSGRDTVGQTCHASASQTPPHNASRPTQTAQSNTRAGLPAASLACDPGVIFTST